MNMNITPFQLAVVLIGIFIIAQALTPISQLASVAVGIVVIVLALLPGWNTGGRRVV